MPEIPDEQAKGPAMYPLTGKHNFKESFMRMRYEGAGGRREWIWNSRDGITPFCVGAKDDSKIDLQHGNWHLDQYRPDYVPAVGERVFVTMTEEQAKPEAIAYVERFWDDDKFPMSQVEHFATLGKEKTVDYFVAEWLKDWGGYPPHLVTVTPAMHEQFQARAVELHKGYRQLSIA